MANKPCTTTTAATMQEGPVNVDSRKGSGGMYSGANFEAVTLNDIRELAIPSGPSNSAKTDRKKLCIIQSQEDAMQLSSSFTSVHQVSQPRPAAKICLGGLGLN